MTKHPVALAIVLALFSSALLPGCDSTANLTEEEHIQRAKDFDDKGDLKAGILELKNAVQKNPNGPQSRLLLGQLYVKAELGPWAEKELRQAQKLGINLETIKVPLGEALVLQQKFKETLEEIQVTDKTSTQNRAKIFSLRGDAKLGLGQVDEACALYAQSKAIDSRQTGGYRGLAQCAMAHGNPDQAVQQLNAALKIDGRSARNWVLLGDVEVVRNNFPAAEKAYQQALKVSPDNPSSHVALTAFQIRQGNAKAAEKLLAEFKAKFGGNDLRWHGLKALLAFQQNHLDDADGHIAQILRVQSGHIPTLFLAGLTNYGLGRHEQASGQLSKVLSAAPGLKPARLIQASIKLKQGQLDEAEALLKPLDLEHSSDPILLSLAGQIAQAKGDREQAAHYVALASRIDPKRAALASAPVAPASQEIHAALNQLMAPGAGGMQSVETDAAVILALIQRKEFDRALAAIARLEEKQPNDPAVHNMRGVVSLGRQDWSGARRHFDKAVALDPDYVEATANLVQLDLRDGKPEAATRRMSQFLKRNPDNAHAMMAMADIAAKQGQEQAYREWLEKATRAQPDLLDPALRLGRHYLARGDSLKALAVARQLMVNHSGNPATLELLAQSQLAAGDKDNAIVSFTKLTALAPNYADAYLPLARLQLERRNLGAARSTLAKAVAMKPDFYEALYILAMLEIDAKKPEEALKIARDAQQRAPRSNAGLILEGDVQMRLGKYAEAAQSFEKALAMADSGPVQIKLHQALRGSGQTPAADARLQQWMKAHPRDVGTRYYLGEVYMQAGNFRQAIDAFKAVVQIAPYHAMAMNNLAWLYDQEKNPLARQTAEQAYKLNPGSSTVQDTLGWILLREGQTARSLELLRQAANSRDPSVQFHYATALAKAGDKDKARSVLKQLLASNRKFPEARQAEALLKQL